MTNHSPTPWTLSTKERDIWFDESERYRRVTLDANGDEVTYESCEGRDRAFAVHAANCHEDLLEVCRAYEKWEADLVNSGEAWGPGGAAQLPRITQELWDRLLEIQSMRNAAIAKAKGE